jgi:hypothetical protein
MNKTRGRQRKGGISNSAGEVVAREGAPLGYNAQGVLPHIFKKPFRLAWVMMAFRQRLSLTWERIHPAGDTDAGMVVTYVDMSSYASVVDTTTMNVIAIRCST